MMDIKYFSEQGLLEFDGEKYHGVVAVTDRPEHYAEAINQSQGRPELLLPGDINELITRSTTHDQKRLRDSFPFQVINLDYTNWLFHSSNTLPISDHLNALYELAKLQSQRQPHEFVLFITTRAERCNEPTFSEGFLQDLALRIDENRTSNPKFAKSYVDAIGKCGGHELLEKNYEAFIPIGTMKLVADVMADCRFEIVSGNAEILVRDCKEPERWLLHLAFHFRTGDPPATNLRQIGRSRKVFFERNLGQFIKLVGNQQIPWLYETRDTRRLNKSHRGTILRLLQQTADLPVPQPLPNTS